MVATGRERLIPFIKWPGGKRQLLSELLERTPKSYKEYHEPFLGGGAMFLSMRPKVACLVDSNVSLVNAWKMVKDSRKELMGKLAFLDHGIAEGGEPFYLQAREDYNRRLARNEEGIDLAALFLFLNKHAFNGLYRVNRNSLFNVPWNKSVDKTFRPGALDNVSDYLKTTEVQIHAGDFMIIREHVRREDFVYFDPPAAKSTASSFRSYTATPFQAEDHARLAALFWELDSIGAYVMLTNSSTQFTRSLYRKFRMEEVPMRKSISRDAKGRDGGSCLIVRNY